MTSSGDSPGAAIEGHPGGRDRLLPGERAVVFTDAVVAIAMTLLILPLLESIGEASRARLTTTQWFEEHGGQVAALLLSFTLIGANWVSHHALFQDVERVTPRLVWLNLLWMLTIVWLPVGTAMIGSGMRVDRPQFVLYIGPLLLCAAIGVVMHRHITARPELWRHASPPDPHQLAIGLSLTALYGLALLVTLAFPAVGYFAMFLLFLVPVLERVIRPRLRAPRT